jgi:regulator of protease activity HflC (stomatin/prohibitin superfamily)
MPELLGGIALIATILALRSMKFVTEYNRLVVFRFGRAQRERGPGLTYVLPLVEKSLRVDIRTVTLPIPAQDTLTRDNISVRISAVCFYQIVDPVKSITKIEDVMSATNQLAQTTLRSIIGQHELDEILVERDKVNAKLQAILDRQTEYWGIKVTAVEIKDVEIPPQMQRVLARQAEAERERRAKIVAAEGECQAAQKLAEAAAIINTQPGAMQLRQLQSMIEVSSEKNSTLIFPIPIELMAGLKDALGSLASLGHANHPTDEDDEQAGGAGLIESAEVIESDDAKLSVKEPELS